MRRLLIAALVCWTLAGCVGKSYTEQLPDNATEEHRKIAQEADRLDRERMREDVLNNILTGLVDLADALLGGGPTSRGRD